MDPNFDLSDSGLNSRKMHVTYVSMLLILVGFLIIGLTNVTVSLKFKDVYSTFCNTVISLAGLYIVGNTVNKFMTLRHIVQTQNGAVTKS